MKNFHYQGRGTMQPEWEMDCFAHKALSLRMCDGDGAKAHGTPCGDNASQSKTYTQMALSIS